MVVGAKKLEKMAVENAAHEKHKRKAEEESLGLQKVKNTFKDVADYISVFEPLLFEEVKSQILQGSNEEGGWDVGAVVSIEETNGFHTVSFVVKPDFARICRTMIFYFSREKRLFFVFLFP